MTFCGTILDKKRFDLIGLKIGQLSNRNRATNGPQICGENPATLPVREPDRDLIITLHNRHRDREAYYLRKMVIMS